MSSIGPAADKADLATIPESLMQPCPDPVTPPRGRLNEKQIGEGWTADRLALQDCKTSKAALVRAVKVQTGATK